MKAVMRKGQHSVVRALEGAFSAATAVLIAVATETAPKQADLPET